MAESSQVPKSGNWEGEENVPSTAYVDNTRKGKNGSKPSPGDPEDSSETEAVAKKQSNDRDTSREDVESKRSADSPLHSNARVQKSAVESSRQRHSDARSGSSLSEPEGSKGLDTSRARNEHQHSREEGDRRRSHDSLTRHEAAARKTSSVSPLHRHAALGASDIPRRVARQGVGSDRSVEHSPLHPQSQARSGAKGGGFSSPSWERKVSSEGSHGLAPSTPSGSRLRSVTRGDDTPDHSPAVPKFGDWDENDPASTEEFTQIFEKVREEKQTGAGKVPVIPAESSHSSGQKRDGYDSSKSCWCFSWCRR